MFNALRPEELMLGVGSVLRQLAAKEGPLEEYERSQALSAYSVIRLLAAEQAGAASLLRDTQQALLALLEPSDVSVPPRILEAITAAQDGPELGEAVAELLAELRADPGARAGVHAVLAEMVDREVDALAAAPR